MPQEYWMPAYDYGHDKREVFGTMTIDTEAGVIEVVDESSYSFGSFDNQRCYFFEKNLAEEKNRSTSVHGVLLNGEPLAVVGGDRGRTGIHSHSFLHLNGMCYLVVSNQVVCFRVHPFDFRWTLQSDTATCFGIHYHAPLDVLISHGELEISRFSKAGLLLWSASGSDIFTGDFALRSNYIEVVDWNGRSYYFDYESGEEYVAQF